MKRFLILSFLSAWLPLSGVLADEGMWLLPLLHQQNISKMKGLGLELCSEDIYHPDSVSLKDAVVIFGQGCTGEVISPEGLILTNHHCGYEYIQQHSSVESDLLTDGFWARSKSEELPNPGLTVTFIDRIEEVTDYVKEELAKDTTDYMLRFLSGAYLNGLARKRAGEAFLRSHPGTIVEIKPFYGGNRYYMFTQKVYSDVRMVGAPPSSIGKFGADTDNWMWPRHTGDFSIFRVYADAEGNPAPYSPDNVPLRPKKYFSLSTGGIAENDFVMLMGFPGRTNHFYTPAEVLERRDIENSIRVEVRDLRQRLLLEEMLADPKTRIQYAGKYAVSTNSYKSSKGMNRMIDQQRLPALKAAEKERLIDWARASRRPDFIEAAATIDSVVAERASLKKRQFYLLEALQNGIEFSKVNTFKALADSLRERDIRRVPAETIRLGIESFRNKDYNSEVDRKVAKAMLKLYAERIGEGERPSFFEVIRKRYKDDIDRYVDDLFARSIYGNPQQAEAFLRNPTLDRLEKDGMILFARSVAEERRNISIALQAFDERMETAHRSYIEGLMLTTDENSLYPDANFTLRLTYGQVAPFSPADGIQYRYYTTLDGVMQKEEPDNWEFVVSPALKSLYERHDFGTYARPDGRMPINFIANTHTTGGNSGSPVMDARGRLVGIGFDRNWEGISGDIQYQRAYQRTIITDIRYILFVIDKFAGATHLIEELDIAD
ncbi:MAG: S46 family peptidase [Coprobacter sp.]|nr:S46 family peptidase [Coprobacter sp.]